MFHLIDVWFFWAYSLFIQDIPRECNEAKEWYKLKKNGVHLIDPDGPDGDEEGNLAPFFAYCDVESHDYVGITEIPHDK